MTPAAERVLTVEGLKTWFSAEDGKVAKSVDGVDLSLGRGETLALVGESGSGKSVTSLSIMRLVPTPPGRIVEGSIRLRSRDGEERDLLTLSEMEMRKLRGDEIGMIFQEPMTSLNPVYTVGEQIAEAIRLHRGAGRRKALAEAEALLDRVGMADTARRVRQYPHQMSGGMRQRVMIAMALACGPNVLIADEPTTALDVTIQAQILELLRNLQQELGMSMLFITHNLGVVAQIADRVAVMYAGRIVEEAPVKPIFARPRHPYTRALLESIPRPGTAPREAGRRLTAIPGQVPSPTALPKGCAFAPRCPYEILACREAMPPLEDTGDGHLARCIRWSEI